MMYKKERPGYLLGGLLTKTIKPLIKPIEKKVGVRQLIVLKKD